MPTRALLLVAVAVALGAGCGDPKGPSCDRAEDCEPIECPTGIRQRACIEGVCQTEC